MNRINAKSYERLAELQGYAEELAQLLGDVADSAREFSDDRSERWRDSEAGYAYDEWLAVIESAADEARQCADSALVEQCPIP